jgi:hypothetical protein
MRASQGGKWCAAEKKRLFQNFFGTIERKTPVETLPTRRRVPAWRKAMVRDEPLSKSCISRQWFWPATITLKSIGVVVAVTTSPVNWGEGGRQKMCNSIFYARQIQHLHIEFRNKSQMSLLLWGNRGCDTRQCRDKRFVVCPKLERTTLTKMTKMLNGFISC